MCEFDPEETSRHIRRRGEVLLRVAYTVPVRGILMESAFGILMTQTCSWDDLKTQANEIEEAGFQSLWVADQQIIQ